MITLEQFQDWNSRRNALENLPHRTVTLLVAAWAYRVLPIFTLSIFEHKHPDDDRPRQAIGATTQWAAEPTEENLQKVRDAAYAATFTAVLGRNAAYAANAAYTAANSAAYAANAAYAAYAAANAASENLWSWLYETYVQCAGEGREWSLEWTTPETGAIARRCVLELDTGDLPYLADALEDAGYPHEADLERLRSGQGEWSDWCVWNLIINQGKTNHESACVRWS